MSDSKVTEAAAIRNPERAHDRHLDFLATLQKSVLKDAALFIRTAVLINGGAVVAILTFGRADAAHSAPHGRIRTRPLVTKTASGRFNLGRTKDRGNYER
jgi:hypothetical protein